MSEEKKELKNNESCEENQKARRLTQEELQEVTGGSNPIPGADFVNIGYDGLNRKDIEFQTEMKRKSDAVLFGYDFR